MPASMVLYTSHAARGCFGVCSLNSIYLAANDQLVWQKAFSYSSMNTPAARRHQVEISQQRLSETYGHLGAFIQTLMLRRPLEIVMKRSDSLSVKVVSVCLLTMMQMRVNFNKTRFCDFTTQGSFVYAAYAALYCTPNSRRKSSFLP